ncbi:CDP-glycerol glycerophosphotransferase family protein [Fibrobacter sp. UWEL]|uniref:CDP-glycerol glycerophosphotransferase family protein n=1 Tax=Fibrobacter sp. UWEL TaxID=1896209 RepID=UPI0009207169|nr:CDP-glycerol glycerophosphotransferase family protein [Fibrobacter sp. UWEL]SHK85427.1 CDP-glycerol glycerophosphotransferase, TagB/SpsB family [Fibrobacter sp. UWEL]
MKYSVGFLLFYPLDFLLAMFFRLIAPLFKNCRHNHPWVIGGHRGRIYEDNSGALHSYITKHTNQPVIWIASNKDLIKKLEAANQKVLRKNSFKARLAIVQAPVLIYSHGEDDLDQFLKYFRTCLGLRVYLNHSANFCKTGYFAVPGAALWSEEKRKAMAKRIVDFDYLLAGSKYEREMFLKAFPYKDENRILPDCGAAHIDKLLMNKVEPEKRILWFPTFRDEEDLQNRLVEMENQILHSQVIRDYLQKTGTTLTLISHINSRIQVSSDFPLLTVEPIGRIGELMPKSMCLISDYSGLVIDWIVFNRPFIRFAYDESDYMKKRSFYIPLREFRIGQEAWSAEELEKIIASECWKDMKPFEEKRNFYKGKIYPETSPVYAKRCYERILELVYG